MALELVLNVTPQMREIKSNFWLAFNSNPICDPDHITLAAAEKLTKSQKLSDWWEKPGFRKWFTTENEFEIKLVSAKHAALDTLVDVMQNPDCPAASRVAAAKQVLEHSKTINKSEDMEKMLEKIAGVSNVKELEQYLK